MLTLEWIPQNQHRLIDISDKIWDYAETALHEHKSSKLMQEILRENGFKIEAGLSGMPTAFKAQWGSGKPVIGYLAEFDALPGLSQKPLPTQEPVVKDGSGHGCGHNLLGAASLGAALALKQEMEDNDLEGTVILFGCPAEETMTGKIFMARDGYFDDLDAALTWHPWYVNGVMEQDFLAMNTARFTFYGTAAHAAAAPELGRSALDAVELMNVGVNYLREHVPSDVRIHYSITDGGGEPNVVPRRAQSLYFVRAAKRETVDSVFKRIEKIALGAALMTETESEVQILSGCWHPLQNKTLASLLHQCMKIAAPPQWTPEEEEFAQAALSTIPKEQIAAARKNFGSHFAADALLDSKVLPLTGQRTLVSGSTDVADVSWITPVGQIMTCCSPIGSNWHTWQFTATSGMSIGHKGMLYAAKVLALAGSRLLHEPELVQSAKEDLKREQNGKTYRSVIAAEVRPT